jgi:hypothetical protein
MASETSAGAPEETIAMEEPQRAEERRRAIEEYIADLHELLKKLRKFWARGYFVTTVGREEMIGLTSETRNLPTNNWISLN